MDEAQQRREEPRRAPGLPPEDVALGPAAQSAFRAARVLLDDAESRASAIVAAAEAQAEEMIAQAARRARSIERDADLLLERARRLLEVAEHKAAVIRQRAGVAAPTVIDLTAASLPGDDGTFRRVGSARRAPTARGSLAARVDDIVASAVAQAVHQTLPSTEPSTGAPT